METINMLRACSTLNSITQILLTVLAVIALPGCISQDEASQATTPGGGASVTGSFSLNWAAPVTRADGTPLSLADIDGYRIYYGTSQGSYPNSVDITDGTATSATVNNIPVGNYNVVMSTYDSNGLESAQSGVISRSAM